MHVCNNQFASYLLIEIKIFGHLHMLNSRCVILRSFAIMILKSIVGTKLLCPLVILEPNFLPIMITPFLHVLGLFFNIFFSWWRYSFIISFTSPLFDGVAFSEYSRISVELPWLISELGIGMSQVHSKIHIASDA